MIIDEVGFNKKWANAHTEAEFIKEFMPMHHFWTGDKKEARLKAAYEKLTGHITPVALKSKEETKETK